MSLELILRLAGGVLLVASNAFFVAAEFALTRLRQFSEDEVADRPGLREAWEMTERLEIHLTGCQLGITSSSILLGIVAEPAVTRLFELGVGWAPVGGTARHLTAVVVAVVFINLVHKIWGEQAPTYLGVEKPLAVLERLAVPLRWWTRITSPFIYLGDGLAKGTLGLFGVEITRSWTESDADAEDGSGPGEVRRQVREVLSRGRMSEERRQEVLNTLDIGSRPVRDIMIPRGEAAVLSLERTVEENLREIGRSRHVRYPLCRSEEGGVPGVVYVPALFGHLEALRSGETELLDLAADAVFVDEARPVSEVIDRLQQEGQELALVRSGERVTGLVTITDAFEAIAGDVEDPLD